jgi:hypothetical protein
MAEQRSRRDAWKIPNVIERRATLCVDMLMDQAERMVAALDDQPPPGTLIPQPEQVREMWNFSPYPNPERAFWGMHDLLLQSLLQQVAQQPQMSGDEHMKAVRAAHQQAESQTLLRVYQQRAKLAQMGSTTIQRSIELAERAKRLAERPRAAPRPAPPEPEPMEGASYG